MKLAISQPCFMPWCGYFALIDYVDEFIFLDDNFLIRYSKIILVNPKTKNLSLPYFFKKILEKDMWEDMNN